MSSSSLPEQNVLRYSTGWAANGVSWSCHEEQPFRFAVGSYLQAYNNYVDIVQRNTEGELQCRATFEHCYPPTKLMLAPSKAASTDLLITTADYLRLWEIVPGAPESTAAVQEKDLPENQEADAPPPQYDEEIMKRKQVTVDAHVNLKKAFDSGKTNEFCSPVTSCDWNVDDPKIIGCCSIDTTVTIWDIEAFRTVTQLVAHDKDVYDLAFAKDTHTFASCGADGSVRIFDLREMEHCTVVYESPDLSPLLRVAWNRLDPTYLTTFGVDSREAVVIDIRYPSEPVRRLTGAHDGAINSIGWAPHSTTNICTSGEDHLTNIWELREGADEPPGCIMTHTAAAPVNNVCWSSQHNDWIAITTGKEAQLLHI